MKSVLFAKNINDLLTQLKNNQGLQLVGGCTGIDVLPDKSISTHGIKELAQIELHERYIQIGPGATLEDIINLGRNHIPSVLYDALVSIANPMIRNMATIGGNICSMQHKCTLYAPLLALETKLEFKSFSETIVESLQKFKKVPDGFVLSNIRVPLMDEDISVFRRIGSENKITETSASYAFIANTEKNIIIEIKLALAGPIAFKSKSIENQLIGHRLPLSVKDIDVIQDKIYQEFNEATANQMISNVLKQQFLNLTRYSFEQLT